MDCEQISLAGSWRLRNIGSRGLPPGVGSVDVPVQLPGDNYSALQAAGTIPDPYWRDNEKAVQWVADADWSFSRAFTVQEAALRAHAAYLSFDSIDTVAEVFVNGRKAGAADDQFRRWRFEVGGLLRPGENELEVRIASPRRAARETAAAEKPEVAAAAINDGTVPGINFLRKCQCSAGWDWGVSLPASGLYGGVSLAFADVALLDALWCTQTFA
ncbi:MAG: glycoside hydrolase family 2 protein, partial [Kiritimatiellae bacterium]|nr:glycoside hydrolase family 2 protein [Kiritimatiellia bacterium]